jgi:hypothetical protein
MLCRGVAGIGCRAAKICRPVYRPSYTVLGSKSTGKFAGATGSGTYAITILAEANLLPGKTTCSANNTGNAIAKGRVDHVQGNRPADAQAVAKRKVRETSRTERAGLLERMAEAAAAAALLADTKAEAAAHLTRIDGRLQALMRWRPRAKEGGNGT